MGIEERRERERDARREAIIRAAMEVYREEGYHATTMEKIAERAELSRATLYLYFRTKDEIFVHGIAAHSEFFGDLLEDLERRLAEEGPERLLERLWESFQKFYAKDPVTFNATLYFHQGEMIRSLPEELRLMLDRTGSRNYGLLCRLMAFGVEKGLFLKWDPRTLAEVFWTAFLGIIHLENSKAAMGRRQHLPETWGLAVEILARGMLKDSGAQAQAGKKELEIHLL